MRNALFVTEHAAGIGAGETPVDTAPAAIGAGVPDASPPPQLGKAGDAVVAQALARPQARLESSMVTPGEEAAGDAALSTPGVFVAERGLEEFLGGEGGAGSLPQDDDRGDGHRQRRRRATRENYGQFFELCPLGHLVDDNIFIV